VISNDGYRWWRKILIDQLGYAVNLVLTLNVAALAYWFSLLRDSSFHPTGAPSPWLFSQQGWMVVSFLALGFAAFCGLACVLNRLSDFRGTVQRARKNPEAPEQWELRLRGRFTWGLFRLELVGFGVGIGALAMSLLLTYGGKL
jgi:polyferredoxin